VTQELDLHIKNNYTVEVQRVADLNAVSVNYPANILYGVDELDCYYVINDGKIKFVVDDEVIRQIESLVWSLRPLIVLDVLIKNATIYIDNSLILYYNKDGEELQGDARGIINSLDPPSSEKEDLSKETYLLRVLVDFFEGDCKISEEDIENYGVTEGYKNMLLLLKDGGM